MKDPEIMKSIGLRISRIRSEQRITQQELALRLGITPRRMVRIESGSARVTLDLLTSIADILGVTIRDLIFDKVDVQLQQLYSELKKIDESRRKEIIEDIHELLDFMDMLPHDRDKVYPLVQTLIHARRNNKRSAPN